MQKYRLLVIEDDQKISDLVCRLAEELDFETHATSDVTKMMSLCETLAPHIIVLDIVTPSMDDFEVLKLLHESNSKSQIVILSDQDEYRAMALRMAEGLNLFIATTIAKPFRTIELRMVLQEIKFSLPALEEIIYLQELPDSKGVQHQIIGKEVTTPAPKSTHYHYLVVEDDTQISATIVGMLHKTNASRIDVAANGEAAVAYLAADDTMPDIIITDLRMPQLDGIALMRRLAEKQFAGGIILVSSSDQRILRMVVNLAKVHRLNILGALTKPFTPAALQSLLKGFSGVKEVPPVSSLSSPLTPQDVRNAIEQNQLVPFFQPKIAVKTDRVIGVETLARWQHPQRGLVPPAMFIPVAEKYGLIDLLTQDILIKTLQQATAWHKQGLPLNFAINVSALSLSDIDLPDRLEAELGKVGLDPSYLTLEITESCLLENIASSLETLLRLRLKGIRLSIDDFGTGYSSLEELHRIPFVELKIDRLFVSGATRDEEALFFMQSAVTLAKKLSLVIVAEGVETQEELDICAKLECNVIQGFFTGRPMPAETFLEWHENRKTA